jgi:hypothetical protein
MWRMVSPVSRNKEWHSSVISFIAKAYLKFILFLTKTPQILLQGKGFTVMQPYTMKRTLAETQRLRKAQLGK